MTKPPVRSSIPNSLWASFSAMLAVLLLAGIFLGWLPLFPYSAIFWRIPLATPVIVICWLYGWRPGLLALLAVLVPMLCLALTIDQGIETASMCLIATLLISSAFAVTAAGKRLFSESHKQLGAVEASRNSLIRQLESGLAKERRLVALNRVSSILTQTLELSRVLQGAVDTVTDVMEVEVALIYGLNRPESRLNLLAYDGVSAEFAKVFGSFPVDEGYVGQSVRENRAIFIENSSLEPGPGQAEMKRMRIQAQLLMPLRARGEVIGVLCVASRRPRVFQSDEVEILEVMADEVGSAMDNAHLYQEQKRITEALSISERDFRSLFELAHDSIWFHDLDGHTTMVNEAASLLTGYSQKEAVGMPVVKLLTPDGLQLAREVKAKLLGGGELTQPYEQQIVKADGSIATVKLTTSLVTRNGRPSGYQHIARDITVEKRMQENLRYYIGQVTRAQEDERKRIARELHDDTCQSLYAVSRQMDNYLRHNQNIPEHDAAFLKLIQEQVVNVLGGVRRFSQDLRPSVLDDLGLLPALHWLVRETEKAYGLSGSLTVTGSIKRFSPEAEVSLFRVVQEGLNNAGKHAGATRVTIQLEFLSDRAVIIVSDDGKGFESPLSLSELTRHGKLGLAGMEERITLLGGRLEINSRTGQGTRVMVEVPLNPS
jgi:PAS domain S-box-containing protein